MKKIKILCINTNGLHNDGITNSILNYYSNFKMSEFEIHMQLTKDVDKELMNKIEKMGIVPVFSTYRKNVPLYIIKTAKQIRKFQYNVVHVHGSSTLLLIDLLAAKLGGCKVRIAHSRNTKCGHNKINMVLRPLFDSLCNERFACGVDAGRWLFQDKDFTVMKNGKNLSRFKFNKNAREKIRKELKTEDYIAIGHVGNFNYQKNHEFLVRVFKLLLERDNRYKLFLMGSGEKLAEIQCLVSELGIENNVIFMGSINNVDEVLNAMDLMLLPSHFEGLPNVVLEWQISGLVSAISNTITNECIVTPYVSQLSIESESEWIDWIVQHSRDSYDREKYSEEGILAMKANGFDIVEDARILADTYRKLVGQYYD